MRAKAIHSSAELIRRARLTSGGFVYIDQHVNVLKTDLAHDITGSYWILVMVNIARGSLRYHVGERYVEVSSNPFAMWVPPYHLIQASLCGLRSRNIGIGGRGIPPKNAPREPCIFVPPTGTIPETLDGVADFLAAGRDFVGVSRQYNPSAISSRIKSALDSSYNKMVLLKDVATDLRLSPSLMTRYFKQSYGITPVAYRHWLRATDAMFLLAEGVPVTDVAAAVGYDDLGRFYKNFRGVAKGTPSSYRALREK